MLTNLLFDCPADPLPRVWPPTSGLNAEPETADPDADPDTAPEVRWAARADLNAPPEIELPTGAFKNCFS